MRKWRPSYSALYIIPEIRGNMQSLEIILNRVLPLRFSEGLNDRIIFLGDYMDGDVGGDSVIDSLINIKEKYNENAIFLRGDHDDMMLNSLKSDQLLSYWMENGGDITVNDYIKRNKLNATAHSIKQNRLLDLIPKSHLEFLSSTENYKIIDDYCFFHGGFDPSKTIIENNKNNLIYDFTSNKYVRDCLRDKKEIIFKDNYTFVSGSNYGFKKPVISNKYIMLGGLYPHRLIVLEMNSMDACITTRGKSRIYKYDLQIMEN